MRGLVLTAVVGLALGGPALAKAADATAGAASFKTRCGICHTVESDVSGRMGPSLKGVTGHPIAARADFAYSPALKGKGGAWTASALDEYLASPPKFAPGTKMFTAVTDAAERANIIAFLKTAK